MAQRETFGLGGLYHSKFGKQVGGRIECDNGIYRVWSRPCPRENLIETFDMMTDGALTHCYDQLSISVLVERKGVELSHADAISPSQLFFELRDSREAQRFKNSMVNAANKAKQSRRLIIYTVQITVFNALTAPYRDIITATGEADTLRAEIEKLNTAKTAQDERYQQLQNDMINAIPESQTARERDLQNQLANHRTSYTALANQNKTLITSNTQMQSINTAQHSSILELKGQLSAADSSDNEYLERIKDLEMQLAAAQTPSAEQTNYIKSLEAETSSMQTKMVQDSKRIQELTASLKATGTPTDNGQIDLLERQLQAANAAKSDLTAKISSLEQQRDTYKAQRNTWRDRGEKLRIESAQKDKQVEILQSESKNLKAMTVSMQDQSIEAVKEDVRRLEAIIRDKDQAMASAGSNIANVTASLNAIQVEVRQKSHENANLKATDTQRVQTVQTLTSDTKELKTTVASLRSELRQKNQTITLLQADTKLFRKLVYRMTPASNRLNPKSMI